MSKKRRVVVTGMGVVSCFGSDVKTYYDALLAGKSGVETITEFPVDDFPTRFAAWVKDFNPDQYVDPKLVRRGDPFVVYGVHAGKQALEDGGLLDPEALAKLDKKRCGVIIGSGMGGMTMYTDSCQVLAEKGIRRVSPFFVPFIITNMSGAILAIDVGFEGPNYSVSTACSTATYSMISAANHIRNDEADLMIAGGVEGSRNRMCLAGFVSCRALSQRNDEPTKASRPWDTGRDGFVLGEGGGTLMLEEYEHAKARGAKIYCEYLGGAINCDAYHMTGMREDGSGIATCVENSLKNAGVTPEQVDYINAHATSTSAGDKGEMAALNKVFGHLDNKPLINGGKSMTGHALGGSGGLEMVACVEAMNRNEVHPTINVESPESFIDGWNVCANGSVKKKLNIVVKNSFGFGGHNSAIVLGRCED